MPQKPHHTNLSSWMREELFHLLSISASLSGLCITVVALMNNFGSRNKAATIVDDMFAVCASLFLLCLYLIFFALRDKTPNNPKLLLKVIDIIFLAAITAMTIAALIMVYTVW